MSARMVIVLDIDDASPIDDAGSIARVMVNTYLDHIDRMTPGTLPSIEVRSAEWAEAAA